jgi:hypothetical protein
MINAISIPMVTALSMVLYGLFLFFHLFLIVFAGILDKVPYNMIWGGRIKSRNQLILSELIAFVMMILFMLLTLIKAGYIRAPGLAVVAHYTMWGLFIYFLFITIMNLLAKTKLEKIFSIASILLAFCSLRLALEKIAG